MYLGTGDPSLVERAQGAHGLRRRARALARVSLDQQVLLGDRLRERERGLGRPTFRHLYVENVASMARVVSATAKFEFRR